jgi:hypothetical protein
VIPGNSPVAFSKPNRTAPLPGAGEGSTRRSPRQGKKPLSCLEMRLDQLVQVLDRRGAFLDLAVDEEEGGRAHPELLGAALTNFFDVFQQLLIRQALVEALLREPTSGSYLVCWLAHFDELFQFPQEFHVPLVLGLVRFFILLFQQHLLFKTSFLQKYLLLNCQTARAKVGQRANNRNWPSSRYKNTDP